MQVKAEKIGKFLKQSHASAAFAAGVYGRSVRSRNSKCLFLFGAGSAMLISEKYQCHVN